MKKLAALVLLLSCVFGMIACQKSPSQAETSPTVTQAQGLYACETFSKYLDEINFVPQLSQGDLMDQMEQYTYDGKSVLSQTDAVFWDGPSGGGLDAPGELFGFFNSYRVSDDREYANYSNGMYSFVPLEGFALPVGIAFDDTIESVLDKLQLADSYKGRKETGSLYSDECVSLELTKNKAFAGPFVAPGDFAEEQLAYELKYTQTYQTTYADGTVADVTRTLIMSFEDGSDRLCYIEISTKEYYKIDQNSQSE